MKKAGMVCRRMAAVLVACGFFGILYPGLCLPRDVCRMVWITEDGREVALSEEEAEEYRSSLLSAAPEEITIKCRLLETIRSIMEKDQN